VSLDTHPLEHNASQNDRKLPKRRKRATRRSEPGAASVRLKSLLATASRRGTPQTLTKSAFRRSSAAVKSVRRGYLRVLAPAHMLFWDRRTEKLLYRRSSAPKLVGKQESDNAPIYHGPIPGKVLKWIIRELDITLRECTFIDFRAGNGRTMLYASAYDFDRVIGYEYSSDDYDDAQLNISQFPRTFMKCRDVEVRRGDRGDIVIPDTPLIMFFPNAARERFLSLILDHVSASYRVNPRRIYVIMENPPSNAASGHDDIFSEIQLPISTQIKLKLFSPTRICILQSLV